MLVVLFVFNLHEPALSAKVIEYLTN